MIQVCNRWNEIWENREVADLYPGVKTTKKVVKLDKPGNQIQLWPRLHFQHPWNLWQSETVSRQPSLRYSRGKLYFLSHLFMWFPSKPSNVLGSWKGCGMRARQKSWQTCSKIQMLSHLRHRHHHRVTKDLRKVGISDDTRAEILGLWKGFKGKALLVRDFWSRLPQSCTLGKLKKLRELVMKFCYSNAFKHFVQIQ